MLAPPPSRSSNSFTQHIVTAWFGSHPTAPPGSLAMRRAPSRPTLENMATTLQDPSVATVLDRMYTESKNQMSLLRERGGRVRSADDHGGTHRGDERVLHPGDPGSRPAAVRAGAGDPSDDGGRIRHVFRHLRHSSGSGGARQRQRPSGDHRTQRHQDRRREADIRRDRFGRCDHHSRRRCAVPRWRAWTDPSNSSCSTAGRISIYR